jgi:hypothetical protein
VIGIEERDLQFLKPQKTAVDFKLLKKIAATASGGCLFKD